MTGEELGWQNHLYKLVSFTSSDYVGEKLGDVSYHGKVSGLFTVYHLKGSDPNKTIVFETSRQQYYRAVVTSEVNIGAHGEHAFASQSIFIWLFVPVFVLIGIIVLLIIILKRIYM